ncbi:hypothetical protein HOK51_07990 [Candidatus Woesearchaeota archaeon]|jgi:hypothetical protein|nr:hypothetical protein [Candidatus Woesearchaeota archaeon]MBT6519766.1 hypothetical protein [Candidatus Woesearchaeota archaeon]MBT7368145.1 hypothetical protein [Candidatus Woesearchaeota archaeon]
MKQTQTNQTNTNQTNLALKKLKGIKPKGVKTNQSSKLKKLIDLCDSSIEKYYSSSSNKSMRNFVGADLTKEYTLIGREIEQSKIEFNENELIDFIFSKANSDLDDRCSKLLGTFTSCLLHLLTARNNYKQIHTRVYIDGDGSSFDYLFYGARNVDRLIIDNFVGKNIACNVGYMDGSANVLVGRNIKSISALSAFGQNGNGGLLVGCNIKGQSPLSFAGSFFGNAGMIVAKEVIGSLALVTDETHFRRTYDLLTIEKDQNRDFTIYEIDIRNNKTSRDKFQRFANISSKKLCENCGCDSKLINYYQNIFELTDHLPDLDKKELIDTVNKIYENYIKIKNIK